MRQNRSKFGVVLPLLIQIRTRVQVLHLSPSREVPGGSLQVAESAKGNSGTDISAQGGQADNNIRASTPIPNAGDQRQAENLEADKKSEKDESEEGYWEEKDEILADIPDFYQNIFELFLNNFERVSQRAD